MWVFGMMAGRVSVRRVVGVVLAALVLSSCAAAPECDRIPGVRPRVCLLPVADRQPAPDVTFPLLWSAAAAEGVHALSLANLQDRVVIVNFLASWCGPCRVEQPDLKAVHVPLPDTEVVLIGVNIEEIEANALAHLAEFAVPDLSPFDPVNMACSR